MRKPSCLICARRAVHRHHVVYRQHARPGHDIDDERNLVPVCFRCHERHHNRTVVIPLSLLPDDTLRFARELMGPAAYDYLRRYYQGEDPRVDAMLGVLA